MLIIENGTVFSPAPRGEASIVVAGGRIEKIGDAGELARHIECELIDARGCIVAPGLIDPHIHLIGGSGEKGFASQTPGIERRELLAAGVTTVIGTLGTDTTTKSPASLLAKVKGLREQGLNAFMWTGGYDARPLTGSIRDDIILIEEIVGAGELAIADRRGMHYTAPELVKLATDCYVAGTLTGKAGVLHLHTGEGKERFGVLRRMLDETDVVPGSLYPTHVNRNEPLFREAIELTRRGVTVDLDLVEGDLARWLRLYADGGGDWERITVSTDAPIGRVSSIVEELRRVVREGVVPLERALALATANPARALALRGAGVVRPGARADLLVLEKESLEIRHVICNGEVAGS